MSIGASVRSRIPALAALSGAAMLLAAQAVSADQLVHAEAFALALCRGIEGGADPVDALRLNGWSVASAARAEAGLIALSVAGAMPVQGDDAARPLPVIANERYGMLARLAAPGGEVVLLEGGSVTGRSWLALGPGPTCELVLGRPVTAADLAVAVPDLPAPLAVDGPWGQVLTWQTVTAGPTLTAFLPDPAVFDGGDLPVFGAHLRIGPAEEGAP